MHKKIVILAFILLFANTFDIVYEHSPKRVEVGNSNGKEAIKVEFNDPGLSAITEYAFGFWIKWSMTYPDKIL
jgi:hypothetical protein